MDKLTAIKIKYNDGTYSDEIPISALAENVEWNNSYTLVDILGEVAYDTKGSIQDQISQLFNEKVSQTDLNTYVQTQLQTSVTTWLNNNVDPVGSAVVVDSSLTITGAAADAKITGNVKDSIKSIEKEAYQQRKLNFEQGAIDAATGNFITNDKRIRAKITIPYLKKIKIDDNNTFFTIFAFSNDTYMGEWTGSGFQKTVIRITDKDFNTSFMENYDYTYWIMFGYTNNRSISITDSSLIHFYTGDFFNIINYTNFDSNNNINWKQGGFNVTTGQSANMPYRIITKISNDITFIDMNKDWFVTIMAFSKDDTYIGCWNGKDFKKEACRLYGKTSISHLHNYDYIFYAMAGVRDGSFITPSDGLNNIYFIYNKVDYLNKNLYPEDNLVWWEKLIKVSTGEKNYADYRIIAKLSKNCKKVSILKDNLFFTICAYSGSTYIGVWNGETFVKEAHRFENDLDISQLNKYNYIYWIMVGHDDNSVITLSDGDNIIVTTDLIANEIKKKKYTYSYQPNIIFQCRNVDDTRFPPESKWSIKAAAENQYDRVRCTVRKTTDGVYFLCHDATINNYVRNMDGTELTESVSSEEKTLAQLNQYDWGIKYGSQYAGATVPLLEDFLKYSAFYNMGVTWHAASSGVQTNEAIDEQIAMIDKYGLTDNLIVITSGQRLDVLQRFVAHNPRISCYVGGEQSYFEDQSKLTIIEQLQTPYNKIYVQLFPWGTTPTDNFIALAKSKNWLLYDSISMTEDDLCNEDMFAKGYSLRELNNVYNIKDTVREWVNSMF